MVDKQISHGYILPLTNFQPERNVKSVQVVAKNELNRAGSQKEEDADDDNRDRSSETGIDKQNTGYCIENTCMGLVPA